MQKGIVDQQSYQAANDHFYQQYQQGKLDIMEYLAFALKPLAEHSKVQLDQWHQQFMQEMILPMRLQQAGQETSSSNKSFEYYVWNLVQKQIVIFILIPKPLENGC